MPRQENGRREETALKIYGLDDEGNFDHVELSPLEEDIAVSLAITWVIRNAQLQHHNGYAELSLETLHPDIYQGTA